jgi:hypothetical protein
MLGFQTISEAPISTLNSSVFITLSGTIIGATETDIRAGGKTIILTVTGDTWIAAGAGSFDLQRQNIINGLTSAGSELLGWNLVPKVLQSVGGVVRTSGTVVTITLDAFSTYDITAPETITAAVLPRSFGTIMHAGTTSGNKPLPKASSLIRKSIPVPCPNSAWRG